MDDKFRIENRIITNLDKASAEETDLSKEVALKYSKWQIHL